MISRRGGRRIAACAVMAMLGTQRVAAQEPPLLPSTRVVQAGPASLYPAISLHDVGNDSNVYDDAVSPKEDFTYTVTPRLYAVMPVGGTRLVTVGRGDLVYYRTYKDQRSVNAFFEGRYEVLEARIRPFVSARFATYRERQALDIDVRARQTQTRFTLGAEVELTPLTSLVGWVRREDTSWDRSEQYLGLSLAEQLNSTADSLAVGAKFRLTPITRVTTLAEIQRDRFEMSPDRDADSLRVGSLVEFDESAALAGQVRAGYRIFRPLNSAFGQFNGFIASAALQYAIGDVTRVSFDGGRDVKYSFDPLQPYYLESGVRARLIQRIAGPFELVAIGERWQLKHQRIGGRSFDGRHEDTTTVGGGVGFRLNREMELTFTVDRTRRTSSEPVGRSFERRRVLASISYGI